jgi:hypothetical protein
MITALLIVIAIGVIIIALPYILLLLVWFGIFMIMLFTIITDHFRR